MSTHTPVPDDHPVLIAWKAYQAPEDYANTKRWACDARHVDGSLWAAFVRGWSARPSADEPPR